jgi:hypothetical protein
MTDQEYVMVLNQLKMGMSQFGHEVANALADGRIRGTEIPALAFGALNLGQSFYYTLLRLGSDLPGFLDALDRAKFDL